MHTYTIDSDKFTAYNNSIFRLTETISNISGLSENTYYLHKDMIGTFQLKSESISYSSFDAVFTPLEYNHTEHYNINGDGPGEPFTEATKLNRLVQDDAIECPNCGSAAGSKEDTPFCLDCGWTGD